MPAKAKVETKGLKPKGAKRGPKPGKATPSIIKVQAVGLAAICDRIASGETQASIAESLGVGVSFLSDWLNRPENAESSARAREESAEAWLDEGLRPLRQALDKDSGIDASAARAYEQACARRAAIRNPKYRDKQDVNLSGSVDIASTIIAARKRSGTD
ncbi:MAG: hypothetical protein PHP57_13485 [Sideroxydans sp.]|nr:hypothetical protein [Sideroxydans sp.]